MEHEVLDGRWTVTAERGAGVSRRCLHDGAAVPGAGGVAVVERADQGPRSVLRVSSPGLVPPAVLDRFAGAAVEDLLPAGPAAGDRRALAGVLALAGAQVARWEAVEEPVRHADDPGGLLFAGPGAARVPCSWLRAVHPDGSTSTFREYQDDAVFGVRVVAADPSRLADEDANPARRAHADLGLPRGRVERVAVVLDLAVADGGPGEGQDAAVLSEVALVVGGSALLLVAAQPYGPDEWHRFDEAVVVLRDPSDAEQLEWVPPRPRTVLGLTSSSRWPDT